MKDEKILVTKLLDGHEQAFNELYKKYRVKIYRRVFGFMKSHEIAEEILQDVFVKVWINRRNPQPKSILFCFYSYDSKKIPFMII